MQKEKVILDTDMANEVDDQFALCYLIKSLKNIKLEAITIAPFKDSGYCPVKTIEDGTKISYDITCKILDLLGAEKYKKIVYPGATKYFFESKQTNLATNKIIEIAKKNDKTTIIAIGAPTNVALALHLAPEIAKKIKIVWLGGNSFLSELNNEFNFRQDVDAVRTMYNSSAELVVVPCKNVASQLSTTIYELEHYLSSNGEIGKYLCTAFRNCKKVYRMSPNDAIGEAKTLWDISAVAYVINRSWFSSQVVSAPKILNDTSYKMTKSKRKITFVSDLRRHMIYQDFFMKMGYKNV